MSSSSLRLASALPVAGAHRVAVLAHHVAVWAHRVVVDARTGGTGKASQRWQRLPRHRDGGGDVCAVSHDLRGRADAEHAPPHQPLRHQPAAARRQRKFAAVEWEQRALRLAQALRVGGDPRSTTPAGESSSFTTGCEQFKAFHS